MIPIPAIDLKGGKVVRLLQGNFKEEKIYSEKAGVLAKRFKEEGARRIHVVDLDGALGGAPRNMAVIEALAAEIKVPLEVGGGIRSLETAETYLSRGVSWVILGTKACLDKGFLSEALEEFGEKIIVGLDALDGILATDGWTKSTKIKALDYAKEVERLGAQTIIYTDISKDGALQGPNLEGIKGMSLAIGVDLIASGGISSLEDLKAILALKRENIQGVVIGKALYENKFSLKDAVRVCLPNG